MGLPNGIGQTQGVCPMGGLLIPAPAQPKPLGYPLSCALARPQPPKSIVLGAGTWPRERKIQARPSVPKR